MRSMGHEDEELLGMGQSGYSILSANHTANGAGEYICLASTDEWMSAWDARGGGPCLPTPFGEEAPGIQAQPE